MPSQQVINQPAPLPPPPPTELAEEVVDKKKKDKRNINRRGASSLTIRRPSVNLPSGGSGANINY
tara:strand:+ start:2433 stop:2627 length:195 start_codon:yes stop_codon:yes gene_type:complete